MKPRAEKTVIQLFNTETILEPNLRWRNYNKREEQEDVSDTISYELVISIILTD